MRITDELDKCKKEKRELQNALKKAEEKLKKTTSKQPSAQESASKLERLYDEECDRNMVLSA